MHDLPRCESLESTGCREVPHGKIGSKALEDVDGSRTGRMSRPVSGWRHDWIGIHVGFYRPDIPGWEAFFVDFMDA